MTEQPDQTPEQEQRGRERLATIVLLVLLAEFSALAFIIWALFHLEVFVARF